jgi:hypothetical protein
METPAPRVIGLARTMDEIADRLRERKDALWLSDAVVDELGGLTHGHAGKILGPSHTKSMGRFSLDVLSQVLGVSFLVIEDIDKTRLMERRWEKRQECYAVPIGGANRRRASAKLIEHVKPLVMRELGKLGAAARNANLSAEKRSKLARRASRARWKKQAAGAAEAA